MNEMRGRRTLNPSPTATSRKRSLPKPDKPDLESELRKIPVTSLPCPACTRLIALKKLGNDRYRISSHVENSVSKLPCPAANKILPDGMVRAYRFSVYNEELERERKRTEATEIALKSKRKIVPNKNWNDGSRPGRSIIAVSSPPPGTGKRR